MHKKESHKFPNYDDSSYICNRKCDVKNFAAK